MIVKFNENLKNFVAKVFEEKFEKLSQFLLHKLAFLRISFAN